MTNIDEQKKYKYILKKYRPILTEQDFYPPQDNRIVKSVVKDIIGGDNFINYCEEFFVLLDEEGYYDN